MDVRIQARNFSKYLLDVAFLSDVFYTPDLVQVNLALSTGIAYITVMFRITRNE